MPTTSTLYHEAGHAVIAYGTKTPMGKVSVLPDADSLGRCSYPAWPSSFNPDIIADTRTRLRVEARIMTAFAGGIAESEAVGQESGTEYDLSVAHDLASYVTGSSVETSAYLTWLRIRTEAMVRTRYWWNAMEGLVARLHTSPEMSARLVRQVIQDSLVNRRQTS